jgi:ABC-type glycerol-3-phosphate transport system substrate-binding protein
MGYPDSFAEYIGTNGADKSTILNLESQIAADTTFDAAGIVPQFYTEGQDYQYTGTWSVPLYKSTEIMYYNKTMFEASAFYKAHKDETYGTYGAKLGDPKTWDWDTLVYVAGQIQSENSGVSDFHALGYDSDANLFISQMAQRSIPYTTKDGKGAGHFLFVDTATGKANQALGRFHDQHLQPDQGRNDGDSGFLRNLCLDAFQAEEGHVHRRFHRRFQLQRT